MQTTVTTKNMVTMPAKLSRRLGNTPGCRLDWLEPEEGEEGEEGEELIRVRVIPTRVELARRLMGSALKWSPEREAVRELVAQRACEFHCCSFIAVLLFLLLQIHS
jgi:hypothetical protein